MIQARGIVKTFGRRKVLDRINLAVGDGELVALMGPNGAGKTTLLRILATLLEPTSGDVLVNSIKVRDDPVAARKTIGVIGHSPYVYDDLTALENLSFFWSMYGLPRGGFKQAGPAMLERVGLSHRAHDRVGFFSRGMRQRMAIARALLHSPDVLLLDEPFSSLDQRGVDLLSRILTEEKSKGASVLVVTHDVQRVSSIADRAGILSGGKMTRVYDSLAIRSGELDRGYRSAIEGEIT